MSIILKNNSNLELIAQAAEKTTKEVSEIIIKELQDKGMINGDTEDYGQTVFDAILRDTTVNDFVQVLHQAGINKVKCEHVEALMACVILGPGDCTECGGEMETTDGECRCTGGDGYLTPYDYEPIWEEKTCPVCGYKE